MTFQVLLTEEAESDIQDAATWYESQRDRLGHEFLDEILLATQKIQSNPKAYPIVYRKVRRILLSKFPFALYYLVGEEEISILAALHASRSPFHWKSRT